MENKPTHSIELIDIAWTLTIFFVIFGHTAPDGMMPAYRVITYSFHMPLLFILAGMSMKLKPLTTLSAWKDDLVKNALALILPYFVWGMICAQTPYEISVPSLLFGSWEALSAMKTLTSLWFLPCFFLARIMVEAMMTLIDVCGAERRDLAAILGAIGMISIGITLPHPENGCFWCADIAFVAAGFILLGIVLRQPILEMAQQKKKWLFIFLGASFVGFFCGTFAQLGRIPMMAMCSASYGNMIWFILNSLSGSFCVLAISMIISRYSREGAHPFFARLVSFVSRYTVGVYLVHKPVLQYLVMPVLTAVLGFMPQTLVALLAAVIMLPLSCVLCVVVERFLPQLLGQFPSREEQA